MPSNEVNLTNNIMVTKNKQKVRKQEKNVKDQKNKEFVPNKNQIDLLKKLTETPAPSGWEDNISTIIQSEIKPYVDKISVDIMGNIIAEKCGNAKGPKIMLVAHMDEVGLVVKYIDDKGFIRFVKIGGIDDRGLLNEKVAIHTKKGSFRGVIGSKAVHLQKAEERKKVIDYEDLFIDVGAKDKKGIEKICIKNGDYISFISELEVLQNNLVCGKSLDNNLGVLVLIEVLKKIKTFSGTIYAVFSTQEEVGLKGARTAAYTIQPDFALAIDTTIAGDTPGIDPKESDIKLGNGPAITFVEASGQGAIVPKKVRDLLTQTADKEKIPYQLEILSGGMTDVAIIQLVKSGTLSGAIGIPTRNLHTPVEIASMEDVNNTITFVEKIVQNLPKYL